jgi:hypothetical protein
MAEFIDEYNGQGGSYILDETTGLRTLIERTQEPDQTPPTTESESQ